MKRMAFVTLFILIFANLGCGSKRNGRTAVRDGRTAGGAAVRSFDNLSSSRAVGILGADPEYQEEFQEAIQDFFRPQMNPEYMGYVSASEESETGARFVGDITLSGTTLYSDSMPRTSIQTSRAKLAIVVWDDLVGQADDKGNVIGPVGASYSSASSGFVEGNWAEITFTDSHRTVTLKGEFDAEYFHGDLEWSLKGDYSEYCSDSAPCSVGFIVETCGFFRCGTD